MSRLSVKKDRNIMRALKSCYHRTFDLTDELIKKEEEYLEHKKHLQILVDKHAKVEEEIGKYKAKLKECQSPCKERDWANRLSDLLKLMESKQSQKQQFKSDWMDVTRELSEIIKSLKETKPEIRKRKSVKKF